MSVVVNVVSQDGSWTAFDGRGRNSASGMIVFEAVVKAEKINDYVCIGYTGTFEVASAVLSMIKTPENENGLKVVRADELALLVQAVNKKVDRPADMETQFVVTGIKRDNAFASYTIDSENNMSCFIPDEQYPFKTIVLSTGEHGVEFEPYIVSELIARGQKTKSVKTAMTKFICDVAKKDPSVNSNVNFVTIRAF